MSTPSTQSRRDARRVREPRTASSSPLADRYRAVRGTTRALAAGLSAEDCSLQSMPDASPVKWHLAHTSWFFETFVLAAADPGYRPFDRSFRVLFNSYYNGIGEQHPRPERGLISRPDLHTVLEYREHVDRRMARLIEKDAGRAATLADRIELGLNHEQQHQELILTDVKHLLSLNPLRPNYSVGYAAIGSEHRDQWAIRDDVRASGEGLGGRMLVRPSGPGVGRAASARATGGQPAQVRPRSDGRQAPPLEWIGYDEGLMRMGYAGDGFSFDNERPRHRVFLEAFELASRPVTNGEFLAFLEDDGYRRPELWLSDGWGAVAAHGWDAPLYWTRGGSGFEEFTLQGVRPLAPASPVCHISYYEADAFARWAGARLPTEAEWEHAAGALPVEGNLLEGRLLHPAPAAAIPHAAPARLSGPAAAPAPASIAAPSGTASNQRERALLQMFGDVWEWTQSPYSAYPRYRPLEGALGEYNGKFMCNQLVLRGGSCATPASHIRATYRNFFPASARWQFSGVRLARDGR